MFHPFHPRSPRRLGRRALLLVPAAVLLAFGLPALAADGGSVEAPTTSHVVLGAPGSVDGGVGAEAAPSGPAAPGWSGEAPVDANLVGITWTGDPSAEFSVEARNPRGRWVRYGTVGTADVSAEAGSSDARSAASVGRNASEPVWIGRSDAVRVRLESGSFADVGLDAVRSLPPQAPDGAAGAFGGSLGFGSVDRGFGVVLVLAGLVLGTVALGWSPWRSRRSLAALALLGVVTLVACGEPEPAPPPETTTTTQAPTTTLAPSTTTTTAPRAPQPAITLRTSWAAGLPNQGWNPGADCVDGPEIAPNGVRFAVIHHTVNSNAYGPADSPAMVRAIWSYEVNTLGFCDLAYNFIVDAYGQIFEGRMGGITRAVRGAHAAPFNVGTVGAAFLGTFTDVQPTEAAWKSMAGLLAWKLGLFRVDPTVPFIATAGDGGCSRFPPGAQVLLPDAVVGHRDVGCTACPGDAFYPQLPWMQGDVQVRMGF